MRSRALIFDPMSKRSQRNGPRGPLENSARNIDAQLGRRLKLRRTVLGLTQEQVALECGISYQQIHKYESGQSKMSTARLVQFGNVLDTPVAWFFDGLEWGETAATHEEGNEPLDKATARLISVAQGIKSKKRLRQLVEFAKLLADEDE